MAKYLDASGVQHLWGLIQNSIQSQMAVNISLEVVQSLPQTGQKVNTIYLVPSSSAVTQNTYDEYLWIVTSNVGAWEKIGTTATDIANYYTKTQIDTKLGTLDAEYNDFASWITAVNGALSDLSTYVGSDTLTEGDLTAEVLALEELIGEGFSDKTITEAITTLATSSGDHETRIQTLESTVGDSSDGLVKDVADLQTAVGTLETTVGDANSGLVKDVADNATAIGSLETTVGDATSGLVKDVEDLQTTVGDSNGGLVKDVDDLQTTIGDPADTSSDDTVYGAINTINENIGDPSDTASDSTVYGAIAGKANASHTHVCADITDLGALTNAEIDTACGIVNSGN